MAASCAGGSPTEQLVAMGMDEGMVAGLGQVDDFLFLRTGVTSS